VVRGAVFFSSLRQRPSWIAPARRRALSRSDWGVIRVMAAARFAGVPQCCCSQRSLPLVVFYCGFSLLYLPRVNAKPTCGTYYRTVHPSCVGAVHVAPWRRQAHRPHEAGPRGLRAMGLPVNETSLHYRQGRDGWVHAVDLRTCKPGCSGTAGAGCTSGAWGSTRCAMWGPPITCT